MEIIFISARNILFGAVVFIINIPIFWSFAGFMDFVKEAIKMTGT